MNFLSIVVDDLDGSNAAASPAVICRLTGAIRDPKPSDPMLYSIRSLRLRYPPLPRFKRCGDKRFTGDGAFGLTSAEPDSPSLFVGFDPKS